MNGGSMQNSSNDSMQGGYGSDNSSQSDNQNGSNPH